VANHYRKTIHHYLARKRADGECPFCDPETLANAVSNGQHVYVVPNLTQYDLWEFYDVVDHLLVIPKRHVQTLLELTAAERRAIMDVCAKYEAEGYNIYARGRGFVQRSIEHQHTHLIKATNKKPRLSFYLRKPYYLIKW
jgi:diadenosine tetraphosphate (Ap4A) HIT family hydrolase